MFYPLHISAKRIAVIGGCSRLELLERLDIWAKMNGFERKADKRDDLVYGRGSNWHALYTFDIRKVPTIVTIHRLHDEAGSCLCAMSCGSWWTVNTPGDTKRLSDQLDLLVESLEGGDESAREPDRGSEHIRERNERFR